MRTSCPNASRYLAKRPPKCGCLGCRLKWAEMQLARIVAYVESQELQDRLEREAYL